MKEQICYTIAVNFIEKEVTRYIKAGWLVKSVTPIIFLSGETGSIFVVFERFKKL